MPKSINNTDVTDLGNGIFLYDGNSHLDKEVILFGKVYYKFLDRLLLPKRTNQLSKNQILTINRHREKHFFGDRQFIKNRKLRSFIHSLLSVINKKSILEVGCGKFPLALDNEWNPNQNYYGLDIDPEAIFENKSKGINCNLIGNSIINNNLFDVCISIFVFHFGINDKELDLIESLLSKSGILIFNVNTRYAAIKMAVVEKLGGHGFWSMAVSGKKYGLNNDTLFIMSRHPEKWSNLVVSLRDIGIEKTNTDKK